MRALARRLPGHFIGATIAAWLAPAGRTEDARAEMDRVLLRATIDRITMAAPIAGAHLASSIRTGTVCRYQPAPGGPGRWRT